ncbi:hypothetical protein Tsp_05015 [Trichinella spiralis]|uniref:hypothetical protein n=1 Tax=Trichinella spiralis TaxID=6334 RepID=UPI0001EFE95D|nr:hypothetical protein Tsp_05015 [Trichinella spiralis]
MSDCHSCARLFGSPTLHDKRLRCSGDQIVPSKKPRGFRTKTRREVITGGTCFSPFGSTIVVATSIFLPHSSRSHQSGFYNSASVITYGKFSPYLIICLAFVYYSSPNNERLVMSFTL